MVQVPKLDKSTPEMHWRFGVQPPEITYCGAVVQRLPALRSPRTRARTLANCARSKGATPSSLVTMGGLKRVLEENLRAQAGPDGPNLADIIEAQKIDLDQLRAWDELAVEDLK